MAEQTWSLGKIYRDTGSKRNPDDQFLGWLRTADDRSIDNSSGIRSLHFSRDIQAPHRHACVVLVSSDLRNLRSDRWIDPLPDYVSGQTLYWGDAQTGDARSADEWRGNRILRDIAAETGDDSHTQTPILLFSKPESGSVQFRGLGVIRRITETEQHQAGGVPVQNIRAEVTVLDCRDVSADWIRRRANEGPSVDNLAAPEAWKALTAGEIKPLSLTREEADGLGLHDYPDTVSDALAFLTPDDIVNAIRRFDAGETAGFGASSEWDLLFRANRYPPKAICGMACRRILGRDAKPSEFHSGEDSQAFRALKRLGFKIVPKFSEIATEGLLLTWNRERWPWTDLEQHIADIRQSAPSGDGTVIGEERWSVGSRKHIPVGTRFFIIKLGQTPKGIIGCGRTASEVYEDAHFDAAKAARGKKARYVRLAWDQLVDPVREGVLDVRQFSEPELRNVHWSSQQSGITIPTSAMPHLETRWNQFLAEKGLRPKEPAMKPEPYTLDQAQQGLFMESSELARIARTLAARKNIILQGPPGTGKSFVARRIAHLILGEKDPSRLEVVQFHQSYSYEDFIQGFRPADSGFRRSDGVFYRFCRRAMADPEGRPYVFVIDEINRGNIAAILGEVLLLIEADKRGPDHAITLTYSSQEDQSQTDRNRFYVPANVHLLGLMNTADRSLAVVDYALRRRFRFFTLWPQFNDRFRVHLAARGCEESLTNRIISRMNELNTEISEDFQNLGAGYQIGHSYFCPDEAEEPTEEWYREIIEGAIEPLLDEYFGVDNPERVREFRDWLLS